MSAVLAQRQRWLYRAITSARAPVPDVVLGGTAVPPHIGLAVYRHAYRARLLEALSDDFSAVATVLGERGFARLVDRFTRAHPPQDATLNAYGRLFAPWLARARVVRRTPLAELARLEWALVEALHAPLATGVSGEALAAITPHAWGTIRLRPAPSLRVVVGRYNTDAVFTAVQRKQTPPSFSRQPGGVAIIRRAEGLRRVPLDALEARVLTTLIADATLADALAHIPARHLAAIRDSFTRWVAQGFFAALA